MQATKMTCEFQIQRGLAGSQEIKLKRLLKLLLPPGKTHVLSAKRPLTLTITVRLIDRWDALLEFGSFDRHKPTKAELVMRSNDRPAILDLPSHDDLVAELRGGPWAGTDVEAREPIGSPEEPMATRIRVVCWLARRDFGVPSLIGPFVAEAGYSKSRVEAVISALHEGDVWPFFLCDRLLDVLDVLKGHVCVVYTTRLIQPVHSADPKPILQLAA